MPRVLVVLVMLVFPAAASAGTVSLQDGVVRYTGADGEGLRVTIMVESSCDPAGPSTCVSAALPCEGFCSTNPPTPGPGCRRPESSPTVSCPGRVNAIEASVGAGDDIVTVHADGRTVGVTTGGGNDTVQTGGNEGPAVLKVDLGDGDDTIGGHTAGKVIVEGGSGRDSLRMVGWSGTELRGGEGDDRLDPEYDPRADRAPVVFDGGGGNDRFRKLLATDTTGVRLIGGAGDDRFDVMPASSNQHPASGAASISCGPGSDRVNDDFISNQVAANTPSRGQHDGPVLTGVTLDASDCPPVPRTFPYFLGQRERRDRSVHWRLTFDQPVRLRIRTIHMRRPYAFSTTVSLPAGTQKARAVIPRRTMNMLRRRLRDGRMCPLYLAFVATNARGEQWSFKDDDNSVCIYKR